MPDPVSRYGIVNRDLSQAAMNLQIGEGLADRIASLDTLRFIEDAEDWAETEIEEFIATPIKPTRAPGQSAVSFDPDNPQRRNYPGDFVRAIIYRATGLLLASEFFENAPNQSDSAKWAMEESERLISAFKDKPTTRVGSGRRRHPNPHMPPNIAPRTPIDQRPR